MSNVWLTDVDNQRLVYAIARQMILSGAPEEEPLLEEIFPEYIRLAQQGDVAVGASPEQAFGFEGGQDLLLLVCLPAATSFVGALLLHVSARRAAELNDAHRDAMAQDMDRLMNEHLPAEFQDEETRGWLSRVLFPPRDQSAGT